MKRRWTIGIILALGILSGLAVFAVSAATLPGGDVHQVDGARRGPGQERVSQLMERVAEKLGVTPDQLRQAFAEARGELGLGEHGPRAGRRGEGGDRPGGFRFRGQDGERSGPPGGFQFRGDDGEREPGRVGPGAWGGPARFMQARMAMGRQAEVAATTIGISREQLREELRGNTLEGVARAHGVNPETVSNALINAAREHVNQAVAEGHLTQERADQMLTRVTEMIQRMMTFQIPDGPPMRDRPAREPRG